MPIAIDLIDTPHPNPCQAPVPPQSDTALLASIRKAGVLTAVLVRPAGNRFELVFGYRRLRLAREAGLTEIPATIRAMTDLKLLEAQVMENMHRRAMHPVDRWKAAADMLAAGATIAEAAVAMGFSERETRQMQQLAGLHPDLLNLAVLNMPSAWQLKTIVNATPEQQAAALKAPHAMSAGNVNWVPITAACRQTRIPRGRALFDTEASGIPFEEDMFAEPGADDQFTTGEVGRFMAAQKVALIDHARRLPRPTVMVEWKKGGIAVPAGYVRRWSPPPDRLPKGETRPTRFVTICEDGPEIGKLIEVFADPPAPLARPVKDAPTAASPSIHANHAPIGRYDDASADTDAATGPDRESEDEDATTLERSPVTNRGRQIIATEKTRALRSHLRRHGANLSAELLGACLVLAIGADNVRVRGESKWRQVEFADLTARLVDPAGRLDIENPSVGAIMAEALARLLVITDPVTGSGSGLAAEWIGCALEADMALSRFDTPEFLATLSKDELVYMAGALDIAAPSKASALREVLAGEAANYRPATFGAPGPRLSTAMQADDAA